MDLRVRSLRGLHSRAGEIPLGQAEMTLTLMTIQMDLLQRQRSVRPALTAHAAPPALRELRPAHAPLHAEVRLTKLVPFRQLTFCLPDVVGCDTAGASTIGTYTLAPVLTGTVESWTDVADDAWSDIPESVSFFSTITVNSDKYSQCVYTNAAALSAGDGGRLSCDGYEIGCYVFTYSVGY